MNKKNNSRLIASKIIADWIDKGFFPEKEFYNLNFDRAFIIEVVQGCIKNYAILKCLLNKWTSKLPSSYSQAVIYVGFYQILFMKNVEDYAAINETVEAAKFQSDGLGAAKLVNALLRRCQRALREVRVELSNQEMSLQLSHPSDLFNKWVKNFGNQKAIDLAKWNNLPPQTFLRINQTKIKVDDFIKELNEREIKVNIHDSYRNEIFVILPRGISVSSIPGYHEGHFVVQDPATIHAVNLLNPKKCEKILDACSSPGGKAMLIAERMGEVKSLTLMEIHEDRIPRLKENLKRCKLRDITVVKGDARSPKNVLSEMYDGILCDVPCSNSGVLQRRADARWRIGKERIKKLNILQNQILDGCSKILSPNGRLVYSTCSLENEENEKLIGNWIKNNSEFYVEDSISIFPPDSKTDGAYAALIRRC